MASRNIHTDSVVSFSFSHFPIKKKILSLLTHREISCFQMENDLKISAYDQISKQKGKVVLDIRFNPTVHNPKSQFYKRIIFNTSALISIFLKYLPIKPTYRLIRIKAYGPVQCSKKLSLFKI